MGRRAHQPDPSQRKQVEAMAAYGIPAADISRVIGIDPKTLRKCYRDELDLGETKANAQVAGFLFTAAKGGNVTAQIFWLKTRAKWREVPTEFRHSGSIGHKEIHEYSDEDLIRIIVSAASHDNVTRPKIIDGSTEPALAQRLARSRQNWTSPVGETVRHDSSSRTEEPPVGPMPELARPIG